MNEDIFQEFKEQFNQFDLDGTGKVNKEDIPHIMRALGHNDGNEFYDEVDVDEHGKVDLPEILSVSARRMKGQDGNDELMNAFGVFDKSENGEIPIEDLERVLSNLDSKLSHQELKELLREADADNSGTIDQEEFVRMMMSQ